MKEVEYRGIQNLWQQEDPTEDNHPLVSGVYFKGINWTIHVETTVKNDLLDDAKIQLGQCIAKLLEDKKKHFEIELNRLYVYVHAPATSKVIFNFGECTLYAQASSSDSTLAVTRAIDRLAQALALMESHPYGKNIMQQFSVTVQRIAI